MILCLLSGLFQRCFLDLTSFLLGGDDCQTEGQVYSNGQTFYSTKDKCLKCTCRGGKVTCVRKECQPVQCSDELAMISNGKCCPVCMPKQTCNHPMTGMQFGMGETVYIANDNITSGCTSCTCKMHGNLQCGVKQCPPLDCLSPIRIESSCCPVCRSDIRCKHPITGTYSIY